MTEALLPAKIFITSDHAGYDLKMTLRDALRASGYQDVALLGATSTAASDYPDDAKQLSDVMLENKESWGIAICGSGIGIAIALNRHPHIRAALCHDAGDAATAREHNNANILVLAARKTSEQTAKNILDVFRKTLFDNKSERHVRRVKKLS